MKINDAHLLYCYKDVTIVPTEISEINSRSECNPYTYEADNSLPIFTAPMSTVVGTESEAIYSKEGITPIIPRNVDWEIREEYLKAGKWVAVSLGEFETLLSESLAKLPIRVCIDIANGHMDKLRKLAMEAKTNFPHLTLMAGNIANPETIHDYMKCGIDYVRVGVGGGSGCITSSNTGIHYPMASLINNTRNVRDNDWETYSIIQEVGVKTKIIADGGIRNYSDVIKALALGADYVMIGGLFANCLEAEQPPRIKDFLSKKVVSHDPSALTYSGGQFYANGSPVELTRRFYGMASKSGQQDISGGAIKTAEGIEKIVPVTITLHHWVENMTHYLRSAMSYVGAYDLSEFYNKADIRVVSPLAAGAFNK